MRNCFILNLFIFIIFYCSVAFAVVHVKGYTKKNGTYVAPHYRSSPNKTTRDNWSTKGNVNPYTGKKGSKSITSNEVIKSNNGISNKDSYENTDFTSSKIYKWIDKNNVTHYSDKPPP